jgi:hypothetical protein
MPERGTPSPSHAHEATDARARLIFYGGCGALLLIAVSCAVLWAVVTSFEQGHRAGQQPTTTIERMQAPTPAPRLQVAPAEDLAALRAREQQALERLGWVDRERGLARIPVQAAMAILAEHGWPPAAEPSP